MSSNFISVNDQRAARVGDLMSDFQNLQYWIAAAPVESGSPDDYYTEGWAALRQCSIDGQHILNCAAETRVPRVRGGPEEQAKAELQQYDLEKGIVNLHTNDYQSSIGRLFSSPRSTEDISPSGGCSTLDWMALRCYSKRRR